MNEYTVLINGVEHTVQLSDADAEVRGLTPAAKAAPAPRNKARGALDEAKG